MSQEQDIQQDQSTENITEANPERAEVELVPNDLQQEVTLRSVVEAILFASNEPLEASKIAKVAGAGSARQVRKLIEELNSEYSKRGSAYHIEQIAGGYVMLTLPEYNDWLKQLLRTRQESKLSQAALETLAIVAYKQPVMRVTVEAIRGVAAGDMMRNLMEKGLVRIVGRAQELGRPLLYGTTRKFLEVFALNSLLDLPKVSELQPQKESAPKEDQPTEEIPSAEDDTPPDTAEENPQEKTS
ncbi:MAG: SMC-Scp complex subunit ScpB [Phycisphaerae bacterium]|nr:SMC-Scp complex subunit ScpB [Phycisphaerae bacterium]